MILRPPFYMTGEGDFPLANQMLSLEQMRVENPVLTRCSVAIGTLTWTQPVSPSIVVPERKQMIHLFDSTGTRLFTGRVARRYVWEQGEFPRWELSASDAWKDYEETPLIGPVTDSSGGTKIRQLVKFDAGNLQASIRRLIETMQTLGAGFQPGHIDDCFDVPPMTFAKSTGAESFADMLRWIPDAMTEVDFTGTGLPRLNVRRRRAAVAVTLNLNATTDDTQKISLEDQPELKPAKVEVQSASRNEKGEIVFGSQVAGDDEASARETQTLVASGPENTAVLPKDQYEHVDLQTYSAGDWDYVKTADSVITAIVNEIGDFTLDASDGATVTLGNAYPSPSTVNVFRPQTPRLFDKAGNVIGGVNYILISGDVPDWAATDHGITKIEGFIRGWFGGFLYSGSGSLTDQQQELVNQGKWINAQGYLSGNPTIRRYGWYQVDLAVTVINKPFPVLTSIYRKQDYDFIFPPPNLAQNLYDAQFLPWVGEAVLGPAAPVVPVPGNVLNVLGGDPDWETAGALVSATEFDLHRRTARVTLGVPARTSAATLLDQFRSAARDNVAS